MSEGRIIEAGTHTELLQLGGIYRRLYEQQFESAWTSRGIFEPHLLVHANQAV